MAMGLKKKTPTGLMSDGALKFLGEFQDALPSIHPVFVQYFLQSVFFDSYLSTC